MFENFKEYLFKSVEKRLANFSSNPFSIENYSSVTGGFVNLKSCEIQLACNFCYFKSPLPIFLKSKNLMTEFIDRFRSSTSVELLRKNNWPQNVIPVSIDLVEDHQSTQECIFFSFNCPWCLDKKSQINLLEFKFCIEIYLRDSNGIVHLARIDSHLLEKILDGYSAKIHLCFQQKCIENVIACILERKTCFLLKSLEKKTYSLLVDYY